MAFTFFSQDPSLCHHCVNYILSLAASVGSCFFRAEQRLFRHFPNRVYAFVWRNWNLVPKEWLAAVLGADAARGLYRLASRDSRIGFEAANQYFYVPADLLEKIVNCRFLSRAR